VASLNILWIIFTGNSTISTLYGNSTCQVFPLLLFLSYLITSNFDFLSLISSDGSYPVTV